eukprot:s221_g30.t1
MAVLQVLAVFVGFVPTVALRPAEEVAEARDNPLMPPCQGRSKVAPSMMSPNIPGAQICMIDFASCDQTVAHEPYKDRYVACRRHSYVDQMTGEAKGMCFIAKWYQDSWGAWKEAQPAVACAASEYYGKGIVAQTMQNKINDNVKRCKDALCKVATSGTWATFTKSAAKKAWPESSWKPGTWGWAKTAQKLCKEVHAHVQLFNLDRLRKSVTANGQSKFDKTQCGCDGDDCSGQYFKIER